MTKVEKTNIAQIFVKVACNRFYQTHCRKRSATVIPNCRCHCHNL